MGKIIAITGPAGSGKSTVSKQLAKKLGNCVLIDVDLVKHMIVPGFHKEETSEGKVTWRYSEWELVVETVGMLAKNFTKHGFDVIIEGFLGENGWNTLQKELPLDYKFLIKPSRETVEARDKKRHTEHIMGEEIISKHFNHFSSDTYQHFMCIDSTAQSVDETVKEIETKLS